MRVELVNAEYSMQDIDKLSEQYKSMAKAIHDIAPWIAASLDESCCKEYTEAAEAILMLDIELHSKFLCCGCVNSNNP